jgi:4,5-DOPA dioxygenase extradiol
MTQSHNHKMPEFFLGHGSPMNVIEENRFADSWEQLGKGIPRPRAIVSISAHWETTGTRVTVMENPRTVHDFGKFPQALFDVQYPAKGDPALAARIQSIIKKSEVILDYQWGLDHGTWGVLTKMYPDASVPVVQLSLDKGLTPQEHYEIAKELKPLRDEGILILGSGNIVHNLSQLSFDPMLKPAEWAVEFDERIKRFLLERNHRDIIDFESLGEFARLSAPTPEHLLPLMYIIALQDKEETVTFPVEGLVARSISMRAVMIS